MNEAMKPPYVVVEDIPRGRGRTFPRERTTFLRGVKAANGKWCRYAPADGVDTASTLSRADHLRILADKDDSGEFTIITRQGNVYARYLKH